MAGTAGETDHRREPRSLIASDRVVGTDVRRPDGTRVGRIGRPMLDNASGQVALRGDELRLFLSGLGEEFYTLPRGVLRFAPEQDAYVGDIKARLRAAPPRSPEGADPGSDGVGKEQIHRYYDATPYRSMSRLPPRRGRIDRGGDDGRPAR